MSGLAKESKLVHHTGLPKFEVQEVTGEPQLFSDPGKKGALFGAWTIFSGAPQKQEGKRIWCPTEKQFSPSIPSDRNPARERAWPISLMVP